MDKTAKLAKLSEQIVADGVTSDLAAQATQLVMGSGDPDAKIVLIGEAPGRREDETGLPFVGASGRFLDTMLAASGLDRADVYITNIVKYRPPNNRDPSKSEKAEFWPYLLRQIDIINPQIIATLGRHSGEAFVPKLQIARDHGQPRVFEGRLVVSLYHPAAALYNGSMRQVLIDDFVSMVELIQPAS